MVAVDDASDKQKRDMGDGKELVEDILLQVSQMYTKSSDIEDDSNYVFGKNIKNTMNLRNIARSQNVNISKLNSKPTIMIIGNTSAGKSTFVNWLSQEAVQKTGMAIETSGFSIIKAGKYSKTLTGPTCLLLNPLLLDIVEKHNGLLDSITMKIRPIYLNRSHINLRTIDIIDTPGVADSGLEYSFDLNDVLIDFASVCDLVLVFLDPIGQALSKRIISVVKSIYEKQPDKVRFCLTKVDDIPTEEERIKIMCQTTQILTTKMNIRHGFDLIPIYIPGAKDGTYLLDSIDDSCLKQPWGKDASNESGIVNRIQDLILEIDKIVDKKIQMILCSMRDDTDLLLKNINDILLKDQSNRKNNKILFAKRLKLGCLMSIFTFFMFLYVFYSVFNVDFLSPFLTSFFPNSYLEESGAENDLLSTNFFTRDRRCQVAIIIGYLTFIIYATSNIMNAEKCKVLFKEELQSLKEQHLFVKNCHSRCLQLNDMYMNSNH